MHEWLQLIECWRKRNIDGIYCRDRQEACEKVLGFIPQNASIGMCGSQTLAQLGIIGLLEGRGATVYNQYKPGLSPQENMNVRRLGAGADFYLASANALAKSGELVFLSAYGNRTSGVAYAPHVVVVCGVNKVTETLDAALTRAREYATPLNCRRLNWKTPCFADRVCRKDICLFDEYKRMCCQTLIIEAEASRGRMTVFLVNEELGF